MTETRGKDFNFFQVVTVAVSDFTTEPDVQMAFRGPRRMMFVCGAGSDVEYSFNGTTVHGRISSNEQFNFGPRNEDKIWFKGNGEVDVHSWAA